MTPAQILAEISGAGGELRLEGPRLRLVWTGEPPPDLVEAIRTSKAPLIDALSVHAYWPRGNPPEGWLEPDDPLSYCRFCYGLIDWRGHGLVFGDRTAGHVPCYEDAVKRQIGAGP